MFKKLYSDDAGKASFSVVAIIILMLSIFTSIYLARVELQNREANAQDRTLEEMVETANNIHAEISTQAHILVNEIMSDAVSGGSIKNLQDMNELLQEKFSNYIATNFNKSNPRLVTSAKSSYEVYVNQQTPPIIEVLPNIKNTTDITFETSSLKSENETNGNNAAEVLSTTRHKGDSPEDNSSKYANESKLNTAIKGELDETQKYVYLQLNGMITYVIYDKIADVHIEKSIIIDKSVKSPLPLLLKTFKDFSENSIGELTDVGRMVRYILSTIAQYRVIQGYGSSNVKKNTSYLDVLSRKDVEIAVNLALILEQGRYYRTFDYNAIKAFDENTTNLSKCYNIDTVDRNLKKLLDDYTKAGTVDPADLFALFVGLDKEPINAKAILAQSIHAILDQYVSKFFDILGIPKEGGDGKQFVGKLVSEMGITEEMKFDATVELSENSTEIEYWANYTVNYSDNDGTLVRVGKDGWHKVNSDGSITSCWWCGNDSSGEYYGNSSNNLTFCVSLTDDKKLYHINESGASLTFNHDFKFKDDNDYGKITVISDGNEEEIGYFSKANIVLSPWVIDLTKYIDKTIQIKFNFVSNESGNDSGWFINNIVVKKEFNGSNKTIAKTVDENTTSLDTSGCNFSIAEKTWENITKNGTIGGQVIKDLRNETGNWLSGLFSGITDWIVNNIADIIVSINNREINLTIDPKDNNSITEDCQNETLNWAKEGFNNIRRYLDDENITKLARAVVEKFASFVDKTFIIPVKDFLNNTIGRFWKAFNDTILNAWRGIVEGFVEKVASNNIIKSVVGAIENILNIITGGVYYTLKNWISEHVEKINLSAVFDKYIIKRIENILKIIGEIAKDVATLILSKFIPLIKPILLSLVNATETIVLKMINRTTDNGDINNLKFLQTTYVGTQFEFWEGNYTEAKENESIEYERFVIYQNPGYLNTENGLNITLSEPRGTHHIYWDKVVEDPFVTQWNITINGSVNLSTRTDKKMQFSNDYVWYNDTVYINISFPVVVSSGWGLTGVKYVNTTSIIDTVKSWVGAAINKTEEWIDSAVKAINDFIDKVLTTIAGPIKGFLEIVNQVIDGFQKLIDTVSNFIATLIEKGMELVKIISMVFQKLVSILQLFIKTLLNIVAEAIIWVAETFLGPLLGNEFEFSFFGLTFTIFLANLTTLKNHELENNERLISASIRCEAFGFCTSIYRLNKTRTEESGSEYDILIDGKLSVSHFNMDIHIDPLLLINERIVDARGKWEENGKGCTVNITLPEIEIVDNEFEISTNTLLKDIGGIPDIPIPPLGIKIKINLGITISYKEKLNITELLISSFQEVWNSINLSLMEVLGDIIQFVKTLISNIVDNIINKFLTYVEENVTKLMFFIDFRIRDVTSGSLGGGFRLSFLIDTGKAVKELLIWLASNIQAYFSNLLNPAANAQYVALSPNVPEHMFIQCSFYFVAGVPDLMRKAGNVVKSEKLSNWPKDSLSVVQLSLNVPFIMGVFTGRDMGQWKAYLGVYQEKIPGDLIAPLLNGTTMDGIIEEDSEDLLVNLWIVKVEVAEIEPISV